MLFLYNEKFMSNLLFTIDLRFYKTVLTIFNYDFLRGEGSKVQIATNNAVSLSHIRNNTIRCRILLFPICCRNFNKNWFRLSPFQLSHVAVSTPCRLSEFTLTGLWIKLWIKRVRKNVILNDYTPPSSSFQLPALYL